MLSWVNCDIEGAALLAFQALSQDCFLCVTDSEVFDPEVAVVRRQDEPEGEATVLTLACRGLSDTLSQAVLRFNRQNTGVRVEIRDYGPAPSAGLAAGMDRMTADMLSGKLPDLICTADLDGQTLIDQGYLEDLWPWIDGDPQLGREALVTPLFDAMSQNGRLYQVADGFTIRTAEALSQLVGDTPGWTVERFFSVYDSMEDCLSIFSPFSNTREQALEDVIALCAEGFIDRESWRAGFDSPAFAALLTYAGAFPEESEPMPYSKWCHWLPEGQQLMLEQRFYGVDTILTDPYEYFDGKPTTCIGFPGVAGNGSAMSKPENRNAVVSTPSGGLAYAPQWTREDVEDFWGFLSGITVVEGCDGSIAAIIRDEAARYFAGHQTAEAAAKAIQSRVNLYLGERKK